jgi:hypothetical protein
MPDAVPINRVGADFLAKVKPIISLPETNPVNTSTSSQSGSGM